MKHRDFDERYRNAIEDAIWKKEDQARIAEKLKVAKEWDVHRKAQELERLRQLEYDEKLRLERQRIQFERHLKRMEEIERRREANKRLNEAAHQYEDFEEAMDILESITKIST